MKPLVEFVSGEKPRIEVFAGEKAERISPFLFGKFTENLGSNVYNGFWAQILRNTGFEPVKYFSHHGESGVEWRMEHAGLSSILPDLPESMKAGVACFWGQWGEGDITYSLSDDRINSDSAQKIEVCSLHTPEAGILQPTWLPAHRTDDYELSVWVKGTVKAINAAIRTLDGRELGALTLPLSGEWKKQTGRITIKRDGIERGQPLLFTLGITEPGTILLDQCFLVPTDNIQGFDPDILRLLKESKLTMLRFPGGNFASGYHWKDGVGPIDERPIKVNPAWDQDEPNHVGTDEHIALCRLLGCEPLICLNAGNGTPEEAAQWVEYCNGGPDTEFGRLRAKNGHPEPYGVKYWEIGNELYGSWQIGHCTPEEYAGRYRRFHDAMKAVDPSISFIANGQDLNWNKPTVEKDADILRSLSTHLLVGSAVPADTDSEAVFRSYMALPFWFEDSLRLMGRQMAEGGVKDPKLAVTELQIFTKHYGLPSNQNLPEALVYAGMANAMIRTQGLVEIFTHSALVNHGGGILKQREFVFPNPIYWAHRMYASQPGRTPVRLRVTGPQFSVERLDDLPGWENVPYLDAIALLDESGKELNLIVTNRHPKKSLTAEIALDGFEAQSEVLVETLAGLDFMARNTFDEPDAVRTVQSKVLATRVGLTHTFPAHSVVKLTFGM